MLLVFKFVYVAFFFLNLTVLSVNFVIFISKFIVQLIDRLTFSFEFPCEFCDVCRLFTDFDALKTNLLTLFLNFILILLNLML